MTLRHARRPLLLAALLGLGLSTLPSPGQAIEAVPNRTRLTPAQQRTLFSEWRQLSLKTNQERITILQQYQGCLSAAGSLEAMRTCQQRQRQALINQRQQQQQTMRRILLRNGITPPAARPGGGSPQSQPQPDGTPMI
jgi:hypothetical protein